MLLFDVQISRMLAAKASLAIRYDALGEDTNAEMGVENRAKLEARLRQLEDRGVSIIIFVIHHQPFALKGFSLRNLKCLLDR